MAIRLSKAFGGSTESWLIQQSQYGLWQVMQKEGEIKVKAFAWNAVNKNTRYSFGWNRGIENLYRWFIDSWLNIFSSARLFQRTSSKIKFWTGVYYFSQPWIILFWKIIIEQGKLVNVPANQSRQGLRHEGHDVRRPVELVGFSMLFDGTFLGRRIPKAQHCLLHVQ